MRMARRYLARDPVSSDGAVSSWSAVGYASTIYLSPCSALITLLKAILIGFRRCGFGSSGFLDVAGGHAKLSFT